MSRAEPEVVWELLVRRVGRVLARDPASITREDRFDDDLHADSLDLLEIVEGVEQDLRERGTQVSVADEELALLQTVGDAADRLAADAGGGREGTAEA
ncbi:MAG: phosphopantetheine-binding protein [Candidatus Rokuibacteriota bacterium]